MKELNENEISMVAGSSGASCKSDVLGSSGMGMAFGTAIGGAIGAPGGPFGVAAGAFLGGMAGAALAGGAAASTNPECHPKPSQHV